MKTHRRGFLASVLSTLAATAMPARAQDGDDWWTMFDDDGTLSDPAPARCFTQSDHDGHRINLWLEDGVVRARITFKELGFHLNFRSGRGGVDAFVAAGGSTGELVFDGAEVSSYDNEDFLLRYFPAESKIGRFVLRIDDPGTAMATVLEGHVRARPGYTTADLDHVLIMSSTQEEQGRFYRHMTSTPAVLVTLGFFVPAQDRWVFAKRGELAGVRTIRNLQALTPPFAEGLKTVDQSKCRGQKCFLTTACCDAYGKPDDCYELEALRAFRDDWLRHQPGGAETIAAYGAIAPKVCAALARDPESRAALARIYWGTIVPCLALIRLGLRRPALGLYRRMVRRLAARYALG
jgi:hypothetical protein